MDVKDFYYDLPQELIAQDPLEDRSSSRLLVLDKKTGEMQHKVFKDIVNYLHPGDCLVINDTKVIPARLIGSKEGTDAHIEILLLKRRENDIWETLVKPGKKAKPGTVINFGDGLLKGTVIDVVEEGNRLIQFSYEGIFVGLGTFRPVKVSNVLDHHMHSEFYRIEEDAANMINETKKNGGRIICVGTTSCRTIESAAAEDGTIRACSGWTDIFIYPGYQFKILDCLITNFHLPESTLVMLVSALAGREHVLTAYEEAIRQRYRFFSFGDAMFIQ